MFVTSRSAGFSGAAFQTPEANLSHGMQVLNGRYAESFLRRHERSGHVWECRFHSVLVERQEQVLEVL